MTAGYPHICCCFLAIACSNSGALAAENDDPIAQTEVSTPDFDQLSDILATWTPKLSQAWVTATSVHSAVRLGPTWSDGVCVWNELNTQPPGTALSTVKEAVPAVKVVADVVEQKDVTVPSNVMYVRFSKPFLEKYFCKMVNERSPIRDTMLGATVIGTRHTIAATELTLLQDSNQARARLRFTGSNRFTTTSHKDGVQVRSEGTTRFTSETTIVFDGQVAKNTPVVTWAETKTTTTGITTDRRGLRGRIALRIAGDEEAASHAQAESIASARTKERVAKGFEKRVSDGLALFTQELQTQYAKLPFEGRFALKEIRCNTTSYMLEIVLIGRGDHAPNFAKVPVFLKGEPDIEFQIHTSLVQKAILDPDLRRTLQTAVTDLVERPVITLVKATRNSRQKEKVPERELKIHWMEGAGEWLALAWHANENATSATKTATSARQRSDRVRP